MQSLKKIHVWAQMKVPLRKVLHKLSKLLLALHNILLANASGRVEFYNPDASLTKSCLLVHS